MWGSVEADPFAAAATAAPGAVSVDFDSMFGPSASAAAPAQGSGCIDGGAIAAAFPGAGAAPPPPPPQRERGVSLAQQYGFEDGGAQRPALRPLRGVIRDDCR